MQSDRSPSDGSLEIPAVIYERLYDRFSRLGVQFKASKPLRGLSGADIFCIETVQSDTTPKHYCLRCYPKDYPTERFIEIHRVWESATSSPMNHFPTLHEWEPKLELEREFHSGYVAWDLSDWIDGAPLETEVNEHQLVEVGRALALVHQALRGQGTWLRPAPVITRRIAVLEELLAVVPPLQAAVRDTAHLFDAFEMTAMLNCMTLGTICLPSLIQRLRFWEQQPFSCQWVLRDVHREHALWSHNRFMGFIDFDAMGIDCVIADITRLFSSFLCVNAEAIRGGLEGYTSVQNLSGNDQELVEILVEATLIGAALNCIRQWINRSNWSDDVRWRGRFMDHWRGVTQLGMMISEQGGGLVRNAPSRYTRQ